MVDIHNHILWGLDDGARTFEDSCDMARQAVSQGIRRIVATPHFHMDRYETNPIDIQRKAVELNTYLLENGIDLEIRVGQEIRIHEALMDHLNTGRIVPIHMNHRTLLIELPFSTMPHYTYDLLARLVTQGYIPIIAHPERNQSIQENIDVLNRLVDLGCILQLNAGSILGHFGRRTKKCARQLLKARYYHIIGSDAHNVRNRCFCLKEAYKKVKSATYIADLKQNAEHIWFDEAFDVFKYRV